MNKTNFTITLTNGTKKCYKSLDEIRHYYKPHELTLVVSHLDHFDRPVSINGIFKPIAVHGGLIHGSL